MFCNVKHFLFISNLFMLIRMFSCASIENVNKEEFTRVTLDYALKLEWLVTYKPMESIGIFYCGYKDQQVIVPLAFDTFGNQFDSLTSRTPPKHYNLPTFNSTRVKKIDSYYDTISKTYKLELLGIQKSMICGCELRYITKAGEFITTSRPITIVVEESLFVISLGQETAINANSAKINRAKIISGASLFSAIFLVLLFVGELVYKIDVVRINNMREKQSLLDNASSGNEAQKNPADHSSVNQISATNEVIKPVHQPAQNQLKQKINELNSFVLKFNEK